jgi:glycerol-3-phosphate acyltransferase PlsY
MNNDAGQVDSASKEHGPTRPPNRDLLSLPGLAAISLYLLILAGVIILGVVAGGHYPPLFLVFAAGFISASAGLLMLFRWAWALVLAAVFLLVIYNLWIFSTQHMGAALVQGLLNLVFFLYLVRPEVREKLR